MTELTREYTPREIQMIEAFARRQGYYEGYDDGKNDGECNQAAYAILSEAMSNVVAYVHGEREQTLEEITDWCNAELDKLWPNAPEDA